MPEYLPGDLKVSDAAWTGEGGRASLRLGAPLSPVLSACRPALVTIAMFAALDWIGHVALRLDFVGWLMPSAVVAGLILVGVFYTAWRPCQPLAQAAFYAAFWIIFVLLGCILSYVAAAAGARFPLMDSSFAEIDAALRFDWVAWVGWVRSIPALSLVLGGAYYSVLPQIVGSILLFAMARVTRRNEEFFASAAISLSLTCLVSALVPALGPWIHFGTGPLKAHDIAALLDHDFSAMMGTMNAAHLQAVRGGTMSRFVLDNMRGIISLPSYHTTLALLCVYAHRGLRWSFAPIVLVNGVMLVSIPSEGGHYLVDMIAGALVAFVALAIVRVNARAADRGGRRRAEVR